MQYQAMSGYASLVNDPRPSQPLPPLPTLDKAKAEVCATKEECMDCKKRPEAPEWWPQGK